MESPSGPASRRHVPWSRLLLAGSLLTFWTPPTTAQLTIETVTPLAEEGSDVLLLAHNVSENTLGYSWQRGERVGRNQLITLYCVDTNDTTKGPAYSGRETLYPNGTLLIQNVTQRDTGPYTLLIKKRDLRTERQTGHLHVYHETGVSIRWFFKGQSLLLTERMTLSSDNSTLTIDPVSREDARDYQCEASNTGNSNRSDPLRLHVTWQENGQALGVGAITGIVIGVLVLMLLAVLGYFIFFHRVSVTFRRVQYLQSSQIFENNRKALGIELGFCVTGTVTTKIWKPLHLCVVLRTTLGGRETLYPNGTRLIQSVTQKDTGSYTQLVTKKDLQTERQTGHLHVYPVLPSPVITSNNSSPREHEDTVVLTCGAETQNTSYMWWINSQSLPKSMRLELSKDKRTLTVVAVTRNDTGPYVCEARNPVSVSRSDPFTLDVLWQENSRALGVGAITGIVIGVLLVMILLAGLGHFIFLHRGNWPAVSISGHGPSGSSVSQASLPDARPPTPIYQELLRPDTDVYCHISHKADVGP
ncbi:hypothetical protein JEQ12_005373 [Ovis aries]|uniref:Ig-like domain-containing protein n=1 Tax=Ovis aries TaxID=9940 RepID=A0A835ZWS0_SHEEP|nr:hypothetical protein JEQ12_005373 [Ovis aries]